MKKLLLFIFILFIPFSVFSLEFPTVNSKKVEIYDLEDKQIIYEIGSSDKTSIASLTKIATVMTAIENIKDLDKEVVITREILNTVDVEASKAGLKAGDKVTYKDLLYASMLPSGADATNSIAILSSGSVSNYVSKMNDLCKKVGLKNTNLVNATGLDINNHYSTADDIRKLLEYSLKNKTFREVFSAKEYTMSNGLKLKSTLYKYHASNKTINKIIGSKTGFTYAAGYCLASLSNINGHEMITIVLDADKIGNTTYNITDTTTLIDFMSNNYKDEVLVEKNKLIKTLPVKLSKIDNYKIYSDKEIKKYLPSDYDHNKIKIKYDGLDELSFRNHKKDKIGTISYFYNNNLLYKQKVIVNTDIKISIGKVIKTYYIFIILFVLILLILFVLFKRKKNKKRKKRKK